MIAKKRFKWDAASMIELAMWSVVLVALAVLCSSCVVWDMLSNAAAGLAPTDQDRQVAKDIISLIDYLTSGQFILAGTTVLGLTGVTGRYLHKRGQAKLEQRLEQRIIEKAKEDPELGNRHVMLTGTAALDGTVEVHGDQP